MQITLFIKAEIVYVKKNRKKLSIALILEEQRHKVAAQRTPYTGHLVLCFKDLKTLQKVTNKKPIACSHSCEKMYSILVTRKEPKEMNYV